MSLSQDYFLFCQIQKKCKNGCVNELFLSVTALTTYIRIFDDVFKLLKQTPLFSPLIIKNDNKFDYFVGNYCHLFKKCFVEEEK